MEIPGFADTATAVALLDSACSSVAGLRDGAWQRVAESDLLEVGRGLERLSRLVFAAQIRLTDEVDQQNIAARRGCSSTAVLLRQAWVISPGEANRRVAAARDLCPQDLPSGEEAAEKLPRLAAAVWAGDIDPENVALVGVTMRHLPPKLDEATRTMCERTLTEQAMILDRPQLTIIAQQLAQIVDPDGTLDERNPASKMELHLGGRNAATGLTPLAGKLDDAGVHILNTAISGFAVPRPGADRVPDPRPATTRRAQALVEALRCLLDSGAVPVHGSEKPHVTITMQWDLLRNRIGEAAWSSGAPLSPAQARRWLCDAQIVPAVLGADGEVLDLGRSTRTFPVAVRRAISLRDGGCTWPGCDRPPEWCEAHHIRWWQRDLGPTSLDNGALLCGFHHTQIHRGEWRMRLDKARRPEFIPPRWIDPRQTPRRNVLPVHRESILRT